jgi:glycosyltransferase involved in cell wall biosynthesis
MIEAMACGTPVIAFRAGSVPEVMADGLSGFIVDDIEAAVQAVERIGEIDRRACRAYFERRFSAAVMAEGYLSVYRQLLTGDGSQRSLLDVRDPAQVAF